MENDINLLENSNYIIGYENMSLTEKKQLENLTACNLNHFIIGSFVKQVKIENCFLSDFACFKSIFMGEEIYNFIYIVNQKKYLINIEYKQIENNKINLYRYDKKENYFKITDVNEDSKLHYKIYMDYFKDKLLNSKSERFNFLLNGNIK